MAIGDKLLVADKPTLDAVKSAMLENKTGGLAIGTVSATTNWQDVISISGSGFVTALYYQHATNDSNSNTSYIQLVIDGVAYALDQFKYSNNILSMFATIKFNTSFKLQFKDSGTSTIQYKCFYIA